jgi:acyl-CoA-binding protein
VQTSYEEKLQLYSLYKQGTSTHATPVGAVRAPRPPGMTLTPATDGDNAAPRPGMLDMLGRAKWCVAARLSG